MTTECLPTVLETCLCDLEERIDPAVETALRREWRDFNLHGSHEPLFAPRRPTPKPPRRPWPEIRTNHALEDPDAMALQQFGIASQRLAEGNGSLLDVRCNYGTPILALPLGASLFIMPEDTNTLPACHPRPGGADALRAMLDEGVPALDHPYLRRVWDMGRRFTDMQRAYPRIARHVAVFHPDFQGPMDVLELAVGSELFTLLYDEPELVHQALELICDFYIAAMRHWETIVPRSADGFSPHWGQLHRGTIFLRDDSAMNLSPDMFQQFILPYDSKLLAAFAGGAIHACGRVDHYCRFLAQMPGAYAFNLSQPHLNNMDVVWEHTVDQGLTLLSLHRPTAEAALAAGRNLRHRVHVA